MFGGRTDVYTKWLIMYLRWTAAEKFQQKCIERKHALNVFSHLPWKYGRVSAKELFTSASMFFDFAFYLGNTLPSMTYTRRSNLGILYGSGKNLRRTEQWLSTCIDQLNKTFDVCLLPQYGHMLSFYQFSKKYLRRTLTLPGFKKYLISGLQVRKVLLAVDDKN